MEQEGGEPLTEAVDEQTETDAMKNEFNKEQYVTYESDQFQANKLEWLRSSKDKANEEYVSSFTPWFCDRKDHLAAKHSIAAEMKSPCETDTLIDGPIKCPIKDTIKAMVASGLTPSTHFGCIKPMVTY